MEIKGYCGGCELEYAVGYAIKLDFPEYNPFCLLLDGCKRIFFIPSYLM